MTPVDNDAARATLRVAESVVALVRAEFALALAKAKASGEQLFLTLLMTAASLLLAALAAVVVVFAPVLWAYRPSETIASLGIAITLAVVSSFVTWRRWRARSRSRGAEGPVAQHALGTHGRLHP